MNTFRKQERLCSRKEMDRIFTEGSGFICFPCSVRWSVSNCFDVESHVATHVRECANIHCMSIPQQPPVRVVISVSKRRFHKAVDRNRVKRLVRECYRMHKQGLYERLATMQAPPLSLSINYIDTHLPEYQALYARFGTLVDRLVKEVSDAQVC